MRTTRLIAALATSAMVLCVKGPVSSAEAAPRAAKCFPRKAETLQGSGEVRIYSRRGSIVACSLLNGRKIAVGSTRGNSRLQALAVGGRYVAYALPDAFAPRLFMLNVHTRRLVRFGETGCSGIEDASVTIGSVAVTGARQLAWICVASSPTRSRVEVRKFDGQGARVLDASDSLAEITPGSLAIGNGLATVYWTRANSAHAAPLRY